MTTERTAAEDSAISAFLSEHFPSEYHHEAEEITSAEHDVIDTLVESTSDEFGRSKGALGLALDFLMVAEDIAYDDSRLRAFDPDVSRSDIFEWYERAATKATLTLKHAGETHGIRSVHDRVTDLFRDELRRTNFPSAAPHYTGEWERYDELLEYAFRLSRAGRYEAAQRLFDFGLRELEAKTFDTREPPFTRPFLRTVREYDRQSPDEEAGSAYQALAYGYVKAEWPHLSLRASKLRLGSARQDRCGDIDGYLGPDLMISIEAKDKRIEASNVSSELGTLMELADQTTAIAIAVCRTVSDPAAETLTDAGVEVLTDDALEAELRRWDYHKQNRALQGMLHFLANIEENPEAVQRLLAFVAEVDPSNTALAHLRE